MEDFYSLTFCVCSCFLVVSINIVVLVIGILVNRDGSTYYGNLIQLETQNW